MDDPADFDQGWPRWDLPRSVQPEVILRYYTAFGRFVHMFARTERRLNELLGSMVAKKIAPRNYKADEIIHALTGSMRMSVARDNLKRFLRMTNAPEDVWVNVDAAFQQLGEIAFFRDRVAHYGVDFHADGQDWQSVTYRGREPDESETIFFTAAMLDNMAFDLDQIAERIEAAIDRPKRAKKNSRVEQAPWRYKPSQLRRTGPKHDPTLRSRERLPRSSRA
jgi:hypothetical protein